MWFWLLCNSTLLYVVTNWRYLYSIVNVAIFKYLAIFFIILRYIMYAKLFGNITHIAKVGNEGKQLAKKKRLRNQKNKKL